MEKGELIFYVFAYLFFAFHFRIQFQNEETLKGRLFVFIACLIFPIRFLVFLFYGRNKNKR